VLRFNQMTAVTFSDILGFGLGFGGCGLVNITGSALVTLSPVPWVLESSQKIML